MLKKLLLVLFICANAQALFALPPATSVNLNGEDSPVFFNDGDSFRVLGGSLKDTKARLAGFNTLESYGPAHFWGDWTAKELFVLAKMGTYNGRDGTWACTSDLSKDGYGRILWICPDLAEDQIRKGFAHALSINDDPSEERYLKAQREAIANQRGIWAHGVPEYVLTSTHSINEDAEGRGTVYNRLVSTVDGHSLKWKHTDVYEECQNVCWESPLADRIDRLFKRISPTERTEIGADEATIKTALTAYIDQNDDSLSKSALSDAQKISLKNALMRLSQIGWVAAAKANLKTCMIHVDFNRRYGTNRAECLR
jgi:endonuclease YncB( thermonuclease family)